MMLSLRQVVGTQYIIYFWEKIQTSQQCTQVCLDMQDSWEFYSLVEAVVNKSFHINVYSDNNGDRLRYWVDNIITKVQHESDFKCHQIKTAIQYLHNRSN